MKIVVIGGTGLIGSKLVTLLRQRGQEVLAASPDSGVNSLTGEGLTRPKSFFRFRAFGPFARPFVNR